MFSNMNIGQGMDKEGQVKMRKYMTIMDSLSEKELDETDSRKLMDINKMKRIAYGSGTSLVCSGLQRLVLCSGCGGARGPDESSKNTWRRPCASLGLHCEIQQVALAGCASLAGLPGTAAVALHVCRWRWERCSATSR